MPELPEVETVRRRLATCLPGLVVVGVTVNDARVCDLDEVALRARLAGRRVTALRRRGKYLLIDLTGQGVPADRDGASAKADGLVGDADGVSANARGGDIAVRGALMIVHLRMTGQLLFRLPPGERPPRYTIDFAPDTSLHFCDVRRFGQLWVIAPADEAGFFAAREMGPEPFGPEFDVDYLRAALAGRRTPLKSFLLDQRRIAGVGNIYADEALFRARLHPLRAAGSVGPRQAARLHAALLETLQAGIDHEGSSIESFVDPAGERGGFQEILNVYQRTGEPCRACGTPVRRVVVGGRGTHFCPRCQPARGGMAATARRRRAVATPPRATPPLQFAPPQ